MKRNLKTKKIGELIYQFFESNKLDKKEEPIDFLKLWREIMGKDIFRETKKIYLSNKILHVYIQNSNLKQDLNYNKMKILKKINDFNLELEEIIFH